MRATTDSNRVVRPYRQTIDAPPAVVFPLLCPVRETEWLAGWRFTMVYSSSGVVEEGAVFATSFDVEATPGSRTCLLKIAVSPCGDQRSHVDVSCAYTALTSAGDPFLAPWTNEKFLTDVVFWERSMNHDLETGTQLIK